MPTITANGTDLFYETRGAGPAVLLIAGLPDGGTFRGLAENLAGEFTVVLYDRRGLSRSPRPQVWSRSVSDEAEDAAALMQVLEVAPAAVVGNSLGALIALELSLRRPDIVRGLTLLDMPPLDVGVPDRLKRMPAAVRFARTEGGAEGPEALFENFLRYVGAWDAMDLVSRERAMRDADVFLSHEMPLVGSYRLDETLLKNSRVPIQIGVGEKSSPLMREMARWMASQVNVQVDAIPGGHIGYMEHPAEVADAIRPFLHRVTRAEAAH